MDGGNILAFARSGGPPPARPALIMARACLQLEIATLLKAWTLGTPGAMSCGALAIALEAVAGGDTTTAREAVDEAQQLRSMGL